MPEKDLHGFLIFGKMCKITSKKLEKCVSINYRMNLKGGEDKSAPSFKKYVQEKEPKTALRFSKRGYRKDGNVTNVPLYLARKIRELM